MNRLILERIIDTALEEDVGGGDLTTETVVPESAWASASILARQEGVLAGLPVARAVFQRVDPGLEFTSVAPEGQRLAVDQAVAHIEGAARSILTAERTALNLLQRLSGIATAAAACVAACAESKARVVDTRKTAPGLRMLDKYAIRIGGADNHRTGLFDGVLIKENHLRAGGGISRSIAGARAGAPHTVKIEVECDTIDQVDEALAAGADIILLDNMTLDQMTEAVRRIGGRALTEASGNMTLDRIPAVAHTGVDLISVGALTHSVKALDLSLEIISWRIPGEGSG